MEHFTDVMRRLRPEEDSLAKQSGRFLSTVAASLSLRALISLSPQELLLIVWRTVTAIGPMVVMRKRRRCGDKGGEEEKQGEKEELRKMEEEEVGER